MGWGYNPWAGGGSKTIGSASENIATGGGGPPRGGDIKAGVQAILQGRGPNQSGGTASHDVGITSGPAAHHSFSAQMGPTHVQSAPQRSIGSEIAKGNAQGQRIVAQQRAAAQQTKALGNVMGSLGTKSSLDQNTSKLDESIQGQAARLPTALPGQGNLYGPADPKVTPAKTGGVFGELKPQTKGFDNSIHAQDRKVQAAADKLPSDPRLAPGPVGDPRQLAAYTARVGQAIDQTAGQAYGRGDSRNPAMGNLNSADRQKLEALRQGGLASRNPGRKRIGAAIGSLSAADKGSAAAAVAGIPVLGGALASFSAITGKTPGELAANTGRDAVDMAGQFIPSMEMLGKAGIAAGGGNLDPLATIGKNMVQPYIDDPIGTTVNHPLSTALMAAGGEGLLGRAAGMTGRTAVRAGLASKGGVVDRATSMVRPDVQALPGIVDARRTYSPDVFRAAGQKASDVRKYGTKDEQGNLVRDAQGKPVLQYQGKDLQKTLHRDANRSTGTQEAGRAGIMGYTMKAVADIATKRFGRNVRGKEAIPLIVQGSIRNVGTVVEDLGKRLQRLQAEHPSLDQWGKAENKAQQAQVSKLRNDKQFLRNPQPAFDASQKFVDFMRPLEGARMAVGGLTKGQVDAARLVPYAVDHMGATHSDLVADPGNLKGLLTTDGKGGLRKLGNDEIHQHMLQNGRDPGSIGFFSHSPRPKNAHFQKQTALNITKEHTRTGAGHAQGTYDSSWQAMADHAARTRSMLNQVLGVEHYVSRYGIKHPSGRLWKDANELHQHMGPDIVAMRYGHAPKDIMDGLKERADPINPDHFSQEHNQQFVRDLAHAHLNADRGGYSGDGQVIGVHRSVAKTIMEHENLMSPDVFTKAVRGATSQWRKTALALNPRWAVGVPQENALRLAHAGAGPLSRILGGRLERELRKTPEGQSVLADFHHRVGSGHVGSQVGARQPISQKYEDTSLEGTAKRVEKVTGVPGIRHAVVGWQKSSDWVLAHVHGFAEKQTAKTLLGKRAIQDAHNFHNQMSASIHLGNRAIKQAAQDMVDPNVREAWARSIQEIRGNWTHLDPGTKKWIQTYSPFGLWYLNSVKLLSRLPVTAPIKTGVVAGSYLGTEPQRAEYGQGLTAPDRAPDQNQGGVLVGSPKGKDSTVLGQQYYSPGPVVGNPLESLMSMVLPQISGPGQTAIGVNFKGQPIRTSQGGKADIGDKLGIVANDLAGGLIPGYRIAQNIQQKGGIPYDNSTAFSPKTKAGTDQGYLRGAAKALLPIRGFDKILLGDPPAAPKKARGKGGSMRQLDQLNQNPDLKLLDKQLKGLSKGL